MNKLIVEGGYKLSGTVITSGAKNSAMKLILAGLLTDDNLKITNTPHISSVFGTMEIISSLGVFCKITDHSVEINGSKINKYEVPLEVGGLYRTGSMILGPLLYRFGKAKVPNPGGCRIGKRPINRHIEALKKFGVNISYKGGFFEATCKKLKGANIKFDKNTHTGTEGIILTAVCAEGETIIENAAEEPEINDLINLLNLMGGSVKRVKERTIVISGKKKLHGAEYRVMPDRNEIVTFAIAAYATHGDIVVKNIDINNMTVFIQALKNAQADFQIEKNAIRFYRKRKLRGLNITTGQYPKFMTDWQAPWAILMTQAEGNSKIHETVYEDRFGYVKELNKMGAGIKFYQPKVEFPEKIYNFNITKDSSLKPQGIIIKGPKKLHNAILEVTDLRAGATLLLSALVAEGKSIIEGADHIDRGYEDIEGKLTKLGAKIKREKTDI